MGSCSSTEISSSNVSTPTPYVIDDSMNVYLDLLTGNQIQILRSHFQKHLPKKGTELVFDDFLKLFPFSQYITKETQKKIFDVIDRDNSNSINFREFCFFCAKISLGVFQEKIELLFDLFDANSDGLLDSTERYDLLKVACLSYKTKIKETFSGKDSDLALNLSRMEKGTLIKDYFEPWMLINIEPEIALSSFYIIPSQFEEFNMIKNSIDEHIPKEGEEWNIINYKWWDDWNIYILSVLHQNKENISLNKLIKNIFTEPYPYKFPFQEGIEADKDNLEIIKPKIESSIIALDIRAKIDYKANLSDNPKRPSSIDNSCLESNNKGILKSGLIPNQDLVLINTNTWKIIQLLYGGGPDIKRSLTGFKNMIPIFDLYPPVVRVYICGSDGHSIPSSIQTVSIKNKDTIKNVIEIIRKIYEIKESNSRLWIRKSYESQWELCINYKVKK